MIYRKYTENKYTIFKKRRIDPAIVIKCVE